MRRSKRSFTKSGFLSGSVNMPRKNGRKAPSRRRVSFKFCAPGAKKVNLVGSFNNWDTSARVLRRDAKDIWKTSMLLTPGTYEYRYVVDGKWQNDAEAEKVSNEFGEKNCLLTVL
jgi:1,4-alpha-glucan branching enzyme